MPWFTRCINCINAFCALLVLSHPTAGTGFVPRDIAAGEAISRHACAPAVPDVSDLSIIADVCNQTLANDTCSDQMTANIQQSAIKTCDLYFGLLVNCLMANNDDHTACSDSLFGYQDCNNYTMQAYAYCGCYYTLPEPLAECANEQLQPQSQDTTMVQATPAPATAPAPGSGIVPSAVSADKETTPTVLPVNGGAASPSSRSTVTFSDPLVPSGPTLTTSLKPAVPFNDPQIAWTSNAAPKTGDEPITVVLTHTTTFTAAGYTVTATITPAFISTVYPCADNGGGVTLAALIPAASAPTIPTAMALAPIGRGPFASHSAALAESTRASIGDGTTSEQTGSQEASVTTPSVAASAQSTEASIADGTMTERINGQETSVTTPSIATPAQSTEASIADGSMTEQTGSQETSATSPSVVAALAPSTSVVGGPSEATAGKNGTAACAKCRRRSRIF